MKTTFTLIGVFLILCFQSLYSQIDQKNRVIILTDIEADPDDTQSLVRLLLYSNVIDIKGLIATTSVWQKTRVAPESIKKLIKINSAENARGVFVIAPEVDKKETAHFILKVTDKGKPPLSRYKRVIVNILPE